ncbi:SMI1/KNR4 family protein [Paenibacillus sp. GCM10023252]|uniref:SMI1/KNR4 family protein n=1 Tax=Paenibacillus sp. GCM10023252 TaxID=3252649 RepID=UPI0036211DA8
MINQKYQNAVNRIKQHPELSDFNGGVPEEIVVKAEKLLGLKFPESYRDFLLQFGVGNFGFIEIYGIINDDFYNSGVPDAVWYTLQEREEVNFPLNLIVIHDTSGGELFCLDTSQPNAPVVTYHIGYDIEVQTYEVIANDFGEFLLERVEFVLNSPD